MYFWGTEDAVCREGRSGKPTGGGRSKLGSREREGLGLGGCVLGGPTGTMREPNSTPMVTFDEGVVNFCTWIQLSKEVQLTSWCGEKRPSQRRMVRDDLPVPESPIQTSFAIKSHEGLAIF